MELNGLERVIRAARMKATSITHPRTQKILIKPDQGDEYGFQDQPRRF